MSVLVKKIDAETGEEREGLIKGENMEPGLADFNRVFEQAIPSEIWDAIFPDAFKYCSVSVCDLNGYEIDCLVKRVSLTHTQLIFNSATSGKAYFN